MAHFASRLAVVLMVICLAPLGAAQLHKNTLHGFQLKPPKKFEPIALSPREVIIVAKFQSSQAEFSQESTTFNSTFTVQFFPNAVIDDNQTREEFIEELWERAERAAGYAEVIKEKKTKIAKVAAIEKHIQPSNGGITHYVAIVDQEDGLFVFDGAALSERFSKKYASDFSKAAKSFKRIDKDDQNDVRAAELEQMDPAERFLQAQIDKLPDGWDHLRTDRYLFLFNAEKNWIKLLADRIEAIRDVYEELYPPETPIVDISIVRVCSSRKQYIAYGGSEGSGGYWSSFQKELVLFDRPPRSTTEAIVNHEAFHQYIYYFYGQLSPHSWYNEGTGDYFCGASMTRTHRIKEYGDPPGSVQRKGNAKEACRLMSAGEWQNPRCGTPLKELMHFSQQEYYKNGGVHYAQGWALVHMLRENKRLQPAWDRILGDYLVNLLAARHQVAEKIMKREMVQAEKREEGSAAEMSSDPVDYYGKADTGEIQNLTYDITFADWTDEDWTEFNEFYLKYVEAL
ncbi:MAG: hypothetical protein ACI9EF_002608 [Pseudohongiellaceae bacterium]|jgi:hypothetical protein